MKTYNSVRLTKTERVLDLPDVFPYVRIRSCDCGMDSSLNCNTSGRYVLKQVDGHFYLALNTLVTTNLGNVIDEQCHNHIYSLLVKTCYEQQNNE